MPSDVRIRQGFAARYNQSRAGSELPMKELWSVKNALRTRSATQYRRRMSERLGVERSLRAERLSAAQEMMEREAPSDEMPSSKWPSVRSATARTKVVTINVERQEQLRYIRGTELQDARELEEATMPECPQVLPTFASAAHLRSDEYWNSLLGTGSHERSYCSWADSMWFQAVVSFAIIANALCLGLENGGDQPFWGTCMKNGLLAFSLFEQVVLVLRLKHGMTFADPEEKLFCTLDMVAVVGCILDQWGVRVVLSKLAPELTNRIGPPLGTVARVLWLLRFLRVTRIVPSLHELLHGVIQALKGLFWVFAFVVMMLYIVAVLCTAIIGKGALDRYMQPGTPSSEMVLAVKEEFSSVGKSMFVLFSTMSSGSLNPLIPLFEAAPPTRLFFCTFFVYAGWTLLAVMTGTVSFTMIAMKAQMVGEDVLRDQERRQHVVDVLSDIFCQLDEDGSGSLDKEEFKMILKNPDVLKLLSSNTNIKVQDLEDLWDFLDEDCSGEVGVDEFMQGFQWLNEDFKPKTLMRMQEKLSKDIKERNSCLTSLVKARFDNIVEQVEAPLCKIHAVTEQVQVLGAALDALHEDWEVPADLGEHDSLPTVTDVDALEASLEEQIDDIIERISRFEVTPPPEDENAASKKPIRRNSSMSMLPFFGKNNS